MRAPVSLLLIAVLVQAGEPPVDKLAARAAFAPAVQPKLLFFSLVGGAGDQWFNAVQVKGTKVQAAMGKGALGAYPLDTVLTWLGDGSGPCGLYLEVGEEKTHGGFDAFVAAVKAKAKVETGELAAKRRVAATGSRGEQLAITLTDQGRPQVERGGKPWDWASHQLLYGSGSEGSSPVTLGWKQGVLEVKAGGKVFTGRMQDGQYTWENR